MAPFYAAAVEVVIIVEEFLILVTAKELACKQLRHLEIAAIIVAQVIDHRVAIFDKAHRGGGGVISGFGVGEMRQVDIGDIAVEVAEAGKAEVPPRFVAPFVLAQRRGADGVLPRGVAGDPFGIDPTEKCRSLLAAIRSSVSSLASVFRSDAAS